MAVTATAWTCFPYTVTISHFTNWLELPVIIDWLGDNISNRWDWYTQGYTVVFQFTQEDDAVRFKLTWL